MTNANVYAMLPHMAKRTRKSPAAVELGKKRWKGTSAEQRSERMRELVKKRWSKKKRAS